MIAHGNTMARAIPNTKRNLRKPPWIQTGPNNAAGMNVSVTHNRKNRNKV